MRSDSPTGRPRPSELLTAEQWDAIVHALRLSTREAQIAGGVLDDEAEDVIAQRLGMSRHTVHTHLDRLFGKLGARTRCGVVARLFATHVVLERGPWGAGSADAY